MSKIKHLFETSKIEEIKNLLNDDNFEEIILSKNYYDELIEVIDQINQNNEIKSIIIVLDEHGYVSDCLEIEIPPGAHELFEINNAIKQKLLKNCSYSDPDDFKFNIEADTILMKSFLKPHSTFTFILN